MENPPRIAQDRAGGAPEYPDKGAGRPSPQDPPRRPLTRREVVAEARKWIGTPFTHQGRSLGRGCDCAGVVVGVASVLGISTFDVRGYSRHYDGETLDRVLDENLDRIEIRDAKPGDVLLFSYSGDAHLAVAGNYIYGGLSMIHSSARARKVVENRLDAEWRGRLIGVYRFRGVV